MLPPLILRVSDQLIAPDSFKEEKRMLKDTLHKFGLKGAGVVALVVLLATLFGAAPALADDGVDPPNSAENLPPVGEVVPYADFTGAPAIPASTEGLWVWTEDVGGQEVLHLRTGTNGPSKTFTGTIRTNRAANFYDLAVVNATGDDTATATHYNEFTFSLTTTGGGEGIDVNWSGRWLFLDLFVNGFYVPSKIFTGAAAKVTTGAPIGTRAGTDGILTLPLTMLDGETGFKKNVADGYYLYRTNGKRFHLRLTTTSPSDLVQYRGRIITEEGFFKAVKEFRGDPRDFIRIVDRKDLEFRFFTKGYVDGIDWVVSKHNPANMIFTLKINGDMAAPNISLGSNPFGTIKAYTFRLVE